MGMSTEEQWAFLRRHWKWFPIGIVAAFVLLMVIAVAGQPDPAKSFAAASKKALATRQPLVAPDAGSATSPTRAVSDAASPRLVQRQSAPIDAAALAPLPRKHVSLWSVLYKTRGQIERKLGRPAKRTGGKFSLASETWNLNGAQLKVDYFEGRAWEVTLFSGRPIAEIRAWLGVDDKQSDALEIDPMPHIGLEVSDAGIGAEIGALGNGQTLAAQAVDRRDFARRVDADLLDSGIESRTRARGKDRATLSIKSVMCGRVLVHKILDGKNGIRGELQRAGFRKIFCHDTMGGGIYAHL